MVVNLKKETIQIFSVCMWVAVHNKIPTIKITFLWQDFHVKNENEINSLTDLEKVNILLYLKYNGHQQMNA